MGLELRLWGVRGRGEKGKEEWDCHCASGQIKQSIQSRAPVKAVHILIDTKKHNRNLLWLYNLCVGADEKVRDLCVLGQGLGVGQTSKLAHVLSAIMS